MADDLDRDIAAAEALADRLDEQLISEKDADVMFAIGILIGRAVELRSADGDLSSTMAVLRVIAETEIRELRENAEESDDGGSAGS